jgi:hypothetical protein
MANFSRLSPFETNETDPNSLYHELSESGVFYEKCPRNDGAGGAQKMRENID